VTLANTDYDAIIIGAGPAGCAAARLLAAWGHRTLLIERPEADHRTMAESIPPSAQKVLAALGVLTSIEDAGFLPWLGNMVWWGRDDPRAETFAPGQSGYLVARRAFDRRLRGLAAEAGAEIREGLVRDVHLAHQNPGNPRAWRSEVDIDLDGEHASAGTAFVLDCSGRWGVVARKGFREVAAAPRTVALVGEWSAREWPGASDTHTLVAAYADGWAWSVPTEPGVRYFTVMVEPGRTGLAEGSADDRYRAELAKIPPFRALLEHAHLVNGVWGADASLYTAREHAGPGFLLVGDAGTFIDPLSSFGVKKALVSGWLAAITVHTALTNAGMRDEALRFFDRRERQMAGAGRQQATKFAAEVAAGTPHPFWTARAALSHDGLAVNDEIDPAGLARDPAVLAAFEDLRQRESMRLRLADAARIEDRPMVRGHAIVMDEHLVAPACPDGVRYLRNVDLVALARLAPRHTDAGEMFEVFGRGQPDVALPDFLGALSVLVAWGVLQRPENPLT
jgi:flavin-dependent dehydrogenase